jgi:universal stress protein A
MTRSRPILHAADFSAASRPAFALAVKWAKRTRAPLLLMHVTAPPLVLLEHDGALAESLALSTLRDAHSRLDRLVTTARRAGVRASTIVQSGVPVEQIVRAARGSRAGVVIIGTHGRTGWPRIVLGSVAARVITLAPCPVVTVRAGPRRGR